MKIKVKVAAENAGRKYAILIPAIRDSDGNVTISHIQAFAASQLLAAEAFPNREEETQRLIRESRR